MSYLFRKLEPRDHSYFWFEKNMVKGGTWSGLSPAAKSIFPILLSFRGKDGLCCPSLETIGALCNRTRPTVIAGINDLCSGHGLIGVKHYRNARGHVHCQYTVPDAPYAPGKVFPFVRSVFMGGNWSVLSSSAQAVYPALRAWATYTMDDHLVADEDASYADDEFRDAFASRKWDVWRPEHGDHTPYAADAGICLKSFTAATKELGDAGLLFRDKDGDDDTTDAWNIYLHPKHSYKVSWLNKRKVNQ